MGHLFFRGRAEGANSTYTFPPVCRAETDRMRNLLPDYLIASSLIAVWATVPAGCAGVTETESAVRIQRTAHGVAHIEAPDFESLAYGVAYAHAADNICQTANHLVTIRGERSRWFGPDESSLLGLQLLPNEQIDVFVLSHMDDAALSDAYQSLSTDAQALARGYVAGFNRYLVDNQGNLPAPCAGQSWIRSMTLADYLRMQELMLTQLGVALMADAVVAARPPAPGEPQTKIAATAEAVAALERYQSHHHRLGSNGWAFGADVTTNGRGVLLGNPHFPWEGVNRFWQMHLTIPKKLDVMGAAIGHFPLVQIGFNRDVAWTHTVSASVRFTIHELELVPGDPTQYMLDGRRTAMTPHTVRYRVRNGEGELATRERTVWTTQFGPVIEIDDAGLGWGTSHAYALKDANARNLRAFDIWLGLNRAEDVGDMRTALGFLGVPWVNTMAADRNGDALYADVSIVPDVENLDDCAPSPQAASLFSAAGLLVLDGSRSDCDWHRDPESPVPGLLPVERMPVVVRRDWVQNSNDSYWLSNPAIEWREYSPLVGPTGVEQGLRTRTGIHQIEDRLAARDGIAAHNTVGIPEVQAMLFSNHNHAAHIVLDDLITACERTDGEAVSAACDVLAGWDRTNNLDARGAHLFREWWRLAEQLDNLWRIPFDPANPVTTPRGLNMDDPELRSNFLALLEEAATTVQAAGYELDSALEEVQVASGSESIGLHGGPDFEGLLNMVDADVDTLPPGGYRVDFGTSYVQSVTFDDHGPVAEALLTYGQSSLPDSPWAFDQLPLYAQKEWQKLPFHPDDVARARVGSVVILTPD